ncbi:hypothetical protein OHB14_45075 [Streptomyces sp. NBC_01613]|uniref:hypothetical protein n=1 Tax=Streptomyces sp. NBC_01613 TaxID=2975896 RepID=UPI00386FB75E
MTADPPAALPDLAGMSDAELKAEGSGLTQADAVSARPLFAGDALLHTDFAPTTSSYTAARHA